MRLHQARLNPFTKRKNDVKVSWNKPTASQCPEHIDPNHWDDLPNQLEVRCIRKRVRIRGFRPQEIRLVTSDMDSSSDEIAHLYLKRWNIEVCFRDIKTTLGLDFIRAKSASMARKCFIAGLIAHNLIRYLMLKAGHSLERSLSFKGTVDTLMRWCPFIEGKSGRKLAEAIRQMLDCIRADPLVVRPERSEPRAVKRRPKGYQLLTSHRHVMATSETRRQK